MDALTAVTVDLDLHDLMRAVRALMWPSGFMILGFAFGAETYASRSPLHVPVAIVLAVVLPVVVTAALFV